MRSVAVACLVLGARRIMRFEPLRFASFFLVASCASASSSPTSQDPPPTDGRGLTLEGKLRIEPYSERHQCFTTRVRRNGGLRIKRVVPENAVGIHHVGVFTDASGREAEGTRECEDMGPWGFVFGSGVGTGVFALPDGVALPVDDGVPLILQVHYLNPSASPIDAVARVHLELARDDEATEPAAGFIVGTTSLLLKPRQKTTAELTCTRHPEMRHVFATFPHMHRLGESMTVTAGADVLLDLPLWDFGDQRMHAVAPERMVPENAPIQARCSYDNVTSSTVEFGPSTTDEMCVAVLYYWPAAASAGLSMCSR
jgi:hypothetical protein